MYLQRRGPCTGTTQRTSTGRPFGRTSNLRFLSIAGATNT